MEVYQTTEQVCCILLKIRVFSQGGQMGYQVIPQRISITVLYFMHTHVKTQMCVNASDMDNTNANSLLGKSYFIYNMSI